MAPRPPPGQTRERIYRFVRERLLAGRPPTVREVQRAVGLKAVESARAHLTALVDGGRLAKEPRKARGYHLPGGGGRVPHPVLVPLLGRVPAGDPLLAVEEVEGYLPALSRVVGQGLFALRVRGESMRDVGILDGDVVIVRSQPTAESGDTVVALVGDEATVKTLHTRGRRVELRPENPAHDTIVPGPGELTLLGRVIEVRRYLAGSPETM